MNAPLIVIAGPTASGKTSLAIEVAERLGAEIINADSQQVYRGFDIGTAKPSSTQMARVSHHLVSCIEPSAAFSAAQWASLADAAIAEIHGRGKRVVVVGGTGLYLRVLLHGVIEAPAANEALRETLRGLARREGAAVLHAKLAAVDPVEAARLPVNDEVRIIRALEIHAATGEAASVRRAAHAFSADRYPAQYWVVMPEREAVYAAINARARSMFEAGLLDEVSALVKAGHRETAPMRAVGYVQALACLDGQLSVSEAVADVAQKTRHYAKRQYTWFRKEEEARVLESPDASAIIAHASFDAGSPRP